MGLPVLETAGTGLLEALGRTAIALDLRHNLKIPLYKKTAAAKRPQFAILVSGPVISFWALIP